MAGLVASRLEEENYSALEGCAVVTTDQHRGGSTEADQRQSVSHSWQQVRLAEVLVRSDDWVAIDPAEEYREVTVRLWGRGVVLRRMISGSEIAGGRRLRVHQRQFVVSRIDARHGAFGLIPDELESAVVTNDFPVFIPDDSKLLPEYLGWLSRTRKFVEACRFASEGTTNRVRLKEEKFYRIAIPLPPLEEQRRIVAKIESLTTKIDEAYRLRTRSVKDCEAFWPSALRAVLIGHHLAHDVPKAETAEALLEKSAAKHRGRKIPQYNNAYPHSPVVLDSGPEGLPVGWLWVTLGSVLTHLVDCINDTPEFSVVDTGLLGLKSTNVKPYCFDLRDRWFMTPEDFGYWNRREPPQAGDILLTREAPMGQACQLPEGHRVCLTQRLMLLRPESEVILPELLLHCLNSPHFHEQVTDVCRGLTTPHIRVKDAPNFALPLPPMTAQRRIVDYLDGLQAKVDQLKALQAKTATELDALLPSILDKAFKGEL